MKVLVTGGAGFIGSNLIAALLRHGAEVRALDNLSPQIHGPLSDAQAVRDRLGCEFMHGDVRDADLLARAMDGCTHVVHLAAETGTGQSMYAIQRYADVNVGGTAALLDHLANNRHTVQRVVVASSRAIHGEGKYVTADGAFVYPSARRAADLKAGRFNPMDDQTGAPLVPAATDESSAIRPNSVYGITKHGQEQLVMTVCPSIGVQGVALRYQNVYGPGQSLSNPYTGILSIFSTRIRNGHGLSIFEDGLESRDFVYIDDVVQATMLALERPEAADEAFGIGSGVPTTVMQVGQSLIATFKAEAIPIAVTGAFRLGDIRHNFADIAKARKLLGFEPKVDFTQGVAAFVEWVMAQAVAEDAYDRSIVELRERGLFLGDKT